MDNLIFQQTPVVTFLTNTFINVPIILKHEETNLIEIIRNETGIGFTTQIPVYHPDGTYLAKVVGNRIYLTNDGKKSGIILDKRAGLWICKMGSQSLFEIRHQTGDKFKLDAELYTPNGYFIKCSDNEKPKLMDNSGNPLSIGGIVMKGCTFENLKVGIWTKNNGELIMGYNH
jgi:hypothetical protein